MACKLYWACRLQVFVTVGVEVLVCVTVVAGVVKVTVDFVVLSLVLVTVFPFDTIFVTKLVCTAVSVVVPVAVVLEKVIVPAIEVPEVFVNVVVEVTVVAGELHVEAAFFNNLLFDATLVEVLS